LHKPFYIGKRKEVIQYIRIPINHESGPRTNFELGRGIDAVGSRGNARYSCFASLLFLFFAFDK